MKYRCPTKRYRRKKYKFARQFGLSVKSARRLRDARDKYYVKYVAKYSKYPVVVIWTFYNMAMENIHKKWKKAPKIKDFSLEDEHKWMKTQESRRKKNE